MPYYVNLANFTDQGIRTLKDSPKRAAAFRKSVEDAGGRVVTLLYTMGQYDVIAVTELPSDEVANQIALRIGSAGSVRTVTLKAWTPAEIEKLVQKL
jgi:uncharacterized protein with GYD domain